MKKQTRESSSAKATEDKKVELIAPAGNLAKMKTAFAFGADAVYAGLPDFSLRVRINEFSNKEIVEAAEYTHKIRKKIYVTVNIFLHSAHLKKLPAHIKFLKKLKVDGIFISDPAALAVIKKNWPSAKIILSTQANCTNWQAAKYWSDQGIRRIILSRELTLDEVKEIKKKVPKLELECFIHGALCMAYSGRCFLSKYFTQRNANLGDCAQPCRWQYKVFLAEENRPNDLLELVAEEHGSYILNSQDLCLIKKLAELIKVGIDAFKIEGRAKSVYYLANVVGAYRRAIDIVDDKSINKIKKKKILDFLYQELVEKLYHRGYTEGFLFKQGKLAQNITSSHAIPNWEFCGQVKKCEKEEDVYKIFITVHNTIKVGDQIEVIIPPYDIIKMRINKMWNKKNKQIGEIHGGSGDVINIVYQEKIVPYSVIRRKIN